MLIPSLYATSLRTRSLRPVRVPSDQNTRWRLHSIFSTDKRQEFLVSPYLPDTPHTIECGWAIAATPHTCDKVYALNGRVVGDLGRWCTFYVKIDYSLISWRFIYCEKNFDESEREWTIFCSLFFIDGTIDKVMKKPQTCIKLFKTAILDWSESFPIKKVSYEYKGYFDA